MAKIYPGEYTILDVAMVAANPVFRTAVTPFGVKGRVNRYVGRAVPWKGAPLALLSSINPGVATGIAKCISMSKAHRETGVVEIMTPHGPKIMPAKAAAMAKAGKNADKFGEPKKISALTYYIPIP